MRMVFIASFIFHNPSILGTLKLQFITLKQQFITYHFSLTLLILCFA